MVVWLLKELEFGEDARNMRLHCLLGENQLSGDRAIRSTLSHQRQDFALAIAQVSQARTPRLAVQEVRDDVRVKRSATAGNPLNGIYQHRHIHHTVLEQVAKTCGVRPCQFERMPAFY